MDSTAITIICISMFAILFCIGKAIRNAYMSQFTHKCDIDVISCTTDYTYKCIRWRYYKDIFNLYIYNFFTQRFEWKSVYQFKNAEKIIKQLTDTQK